VEAASGDAAIGAFEAANPPIDVILTDVVMPGSLQGPELVALLRNHRRDLPVVYMSGYPHEANVHGNGIRARDISLTKPMERSTLLAALAQVLG
jgi:CheY-like chemotaxis protein